MKMTISVLLLSAIFALAVAAPADMKTYTRASQSLTNKLQQKVRDNGCNVNVCFAIDGSGSVKQKGFDAEKQFVFDIVSIINVDEPAGLAATQFGTANSAVSSLTFSSADFNKRLNAARFLNAGFTQIRGGLLYCFNELRRQTKDANKIVLLTDGRANLGGDPVPIADLFRRTTGDICAVGVAYRNERKLLDIVGGKARNVLRVDDFFKLDDILEELVGEVCGF